MALERIREIHAENRRVYGAPRVHAELRMAHGIRMGVTRGAADALDGLSGLIPMRRDRITIRVAGVRVADDLVRRQFRPTAPNVLWAAGITYLRTWQGWLYLVQDAFARRILGWSMADHMQKEVVIDALQMAIARRRPEAGLTHHSDQGSQFVSLAFGQPVARPGSPGRWDRAATAWITPSLRHSLRL